MPSDNNLIWIDLEMTGLDPDTDTIIEIATMVTDKELNILAEGPELAIHTAMRCSRAWMTGTRASTPPRDWWRGCAQSRVTLAEAQRRTLEFLAPLVNPSVSPMCGNSICQDRRFLARQMPELERFFHYRNLDVSTLKELARRWAPEVSDGFSKQGAHLAKADIYESIRELQHYRAHLFAPAYSGAPRCAGLAQLRAASPAAPGTARSPPPYPGSGTCSRCPARAASAPGRGDPRAPGRRCRCTCRACGRR